MLKFLLPFFLILTVMLNQCLARKFQAIDIPHAYCGNGSPYRVFFSPGSDPSKLAVEFMGGGACWSFSTCYGPNFRAWVHQIPKLVSNMNVLLDKEGDLAEHSVLYFPYCTADVFLGRHMAQYGIGRVWHFGAINIEQTLQYFMRKNIVPFNALSDVVLMGSSAGGIASLLHAPLFDQYLPSSSKRTIIADSPGMHFGEDFWQKFPLHMQHDFSHGFARVGLGDILNDGMVAPLIKDICSNLGTWEIGFLQGSQDIIMSGLFGELSPSEHRERVYGPRGIYQNTLGLKNCSAWVPDTYMHTFLINPLTGSHIHAGEIDAETYARRIYRRQNDGRNYK